MPRYPFHARTRPPFRTKPLVEDIARVVRRGRLQHLGNPTGRVTLTGGPGLVYLPVPLDASSELVINLDTITLESGYLNFPSGPNGAANVYYNQALLDRVLANQWLDQWKITLPWTWTIRDYTDGMVSSAFPTGHSRSGYLTGSTAQGPNHSAQGGKLAALLACLAGSTQDYTALADQIHGPDSAEESYALFTSEDGGELAYYLLRITRTGLWSAPIVFSTIGAAALQDLSLDVGGRISN
jgi:hypothetical protein